MSRGDVGFRIDDESMRRIESLLTRLDNPQRGFKNAVGRTASRVKREASKVVARELTLDKKSINRRIQVVKRPRLDDPTAIVRFDRERRNPSLASFAELFDPREEPFDPFAGGVTVKVRKKEPLENHPRAFVAKGRGGSVLVLQRVGRKRKPLMALRGPSPLGVFQGKPGMAESVLGRSAEFLEEQVTKEYDKQLKKKA